MCIPRPAPVLSPLTSKPPTADDPAGLRPAHGHAATGSRRQRLWDLPGAAHCPVVGVCLPIQALRRLVDKLNGPRAQADDYALHCSVVADCRQYDTDSAFDSAHAGSTFRGRMDAEWLGADGTGNTCSVLAGLAFLLVWLEGSQGPRRQHGLTGRPRY